MFIYLFFVLVRQLSPPDNDKVGAPKEGPTQGLSR